MKKAVIFAEKVFKNKEAQALYEQEILYPYVIEYGIDTNGKIYFHHANGNVYRYTRKEYLKRAKGFEPIQ